MALSEAKRRSNDTYIAAHYERLPVSYSREFCAEVRAAAGASGVSLAGYVRAALEAYMQAAQPGANRTEPPASDPAQAETEAPSADHVEQVKRKRGRPRKVRAVDMGADGMDTDAHNSTDAVGIDAGTIAPPRRKRGRPRKVNP